MGLEERKGKVNRTYMVLGSRSLFVACRFNPDDS